VSHLALTEDGEDTTTREHHVLHCAVARAHGDGAQHRRLELHWHDGAHAAVGDVDVSHELRYSDGRDVATQDDLAVTVNSTADGTTSTTAAATATVDRGSDGRGDLGHRSIGLLAERQQQLSEQPRQHQLAL
jgi:hypothetical protein